MLDASPSRGVRPLRVRSSAVLAPHQRPRPNGTAAGGPSAFVARRAAPAANAVAPVLSPPEERLKLIEHREQVRLRLAESAALEQRLDAAEGVSGAGVASVLLGRQEKVDFYSTAGPEWMVKRRALGGNLASLTFLTPPGIDPR